MKTKNKFIFHYERASDTITATVAFFGGRVKKRTLSFILLALIFSLFRSPAVAAGGDIQITDIKMAHGIDEKYQPIGTSKDFTGDADKIYCWFEWKNAEAKSPITAKWTYLTEDIPILEYPFSIPRKQGAGGVALDMPQEKTFPAGTYEIQLLQDKKILKSLRFEILEKK